MIKTHIMFLCIAISFILSGCIRYETDNFSINNNENKENPKTIIESYSKNKNMNNKIKSTKSNLVIKEKVEAKKRSSITQSLIGMGYKELVDIIGLPNINKIDDPFDVLVYKNSTCIIHFFLYHV